MEEQTSIDCADRLLSSMIKNWHKKFAFRMLRLKCLCGYPPKTYTLENVKPGATYYYCGNNKKDDQCKFFYWHEELHHFQEELCYCGQPTVALPPSKTNQKSFMFVTEQNTKKDVNIAKHYSKLLLLMT